MPNFKTLDKNTVRKLSKRKQEPLWMLDLRLEALEVYKKTPLPSFGPSLKNLNLEDITFYKSPETAKKNSWEDIPADVKADFDKLGIPQAEKDFLAGVEAQMNSEAIYGSLKEKLKKQGIIFTNIEEGLQKHPEIFQKYFGKLVKPTDNKFSALNGAVWSGGSFLYVPENVTVTLPLQAYFKIGALNLGQFERTLIIAEKGSKVHYVEGCTAPSYLKNMLHAGVVEVFVAEDAQVKYTTIQNWSKNVYNLVTKKSSVEARGKMSWVDANLGSKVTMKYPACYLRGSGAHGEMLSVAYTGSGQVISAGARMVHEAPMTTSKVVSKSLAGSKGVSNYRGEVLVKEGAKNSRAFVECDSLLLTKTAKSNSYPKLVIKEASAQVEHEASASKLEEEKLQYLRSRGLSFLEAKDLIVQGFIEPVLEQLPLEYALEFNQLLQGDLL
ncbi:Fe-S cluster assembly protein SufB [candidate division WWE3 bacterium]|nr:Fe-S cluster assembly protein SufB [candidate division WWE3 bacterium]